MKKLMMAVAIVCATVGVQAASINWTNVGYQNKKVNSEADGGYTWVMSTLPAVGEEMDKLTLSSWKVTPPEGGLVSAYSVRVNTFDAEGQIAGDYVYLDEAQCGVFSADPGWYTAKSVDNWDPESAGSVSIATGEMFQIGSDCGAVITVPSAL